jgi:fructosamine-3-kinase
MIKNGPEVNHLHSFIMQALTQMGDSLDLTEILPVTGGCINQAFYVRTQKREYFVKVNQNVKPDFFRREADGLNRLRNAQVISVPAVLGEFYDSKERVAVLILEWVQGTENPHTEEWLGQGVARLHQTQGPAFGLEHDNYIGTLPQKNGWWDQWPSFYREQRLGVQLEWGKKVGTIPLSRSKKLEKLMERLDQFLPADVSPSLIHGDLWRGNWKVGTGGKPYLIDPAVCYAHSEMEMAFTELFGGFSERFYRAYTEIHPISPDYPERKPLYQLYYLLVHLNVFGETYGPAVDRILNMYIG